MGTYEEQPPLWRLVPRVVEITLSGDTLFADMDGRGKVPLIAQSETGFSGLYGLGVEFIKGGAGGLFVKHVSGDYRFAPEVGDLWPGGIERRLTPSGCARSSCEALERHGADLNLLPDSDLIETFCENERDLGRMDRTLKP